jgi:hypothetical protein
VIGKHTGTKRGGVVTWVKGRWTAQGDTHDLKDVETKIDRAMHDLLFSEVWRGFVQQVHAPLSVPSSHRLPRKIARLTSPSIQPP